MMKKKLILPLLLLFSAPFVQAQVVYSQIEVTLTNETVVEQLVELGMTIDHPELTEENTLAFYVNQQERQLLNSAGLEYNVLIEDYNTFYLQQSQEDLANIPLMQRSSNVANGFDLGSMGGFYTLAEMEAKLDEMFTDYPNLVTQKASIGTTVEGRDIWMVKISDNPNVNEGEPVAYFDAIHHAREPLAMATTINYMFWLLENYALDPQVQFLVDNRELYFVPIVNPDGYEYNRQTNPNGGGLWRKNRNPNGGGNCPGVDLNRNYSFGYANNNQCSSTDPCSGIYRGEEAFSELESQAVRDFMAVIQPKTAFSTHSTAGSYLMPYGFDTSPPEFDIYSEWASVFLSENDYPYGVTFQMLGYTSCGTTRDYMHSEGIYGWTPEIDGQGFWPPQSTIFDLVGENVFPLFYQSWIAGALVDVQSHSVAGDVLVGDSFDLTVEVKNVGVGADANNVTVKVDPTQAGVSVNPSISYGTVTARSRADNSSNPFIVELDPSFDEPTVVLTITTLQDGVQNDTVEIELVVGEKTVLLFDDAESGAANWSASGNGIPWGVVLDDAYSGVQCFGDSNGGNGENGTNNALALVTALDLTGMNNPYVSFVSKYSMEQGDFVNFQASTDGGQNWQTLQNFTTSEPWHSVLISLAAYSDEAAVLFRFALTNDGSIPGDGFYFDDFEVSNYENGILSMNGEDLLNSVSIYPNPFDNELNVVWSKGLSREPVRINFYDITGRLLDSLEQEGANQRIQISDLAAWPTGIYFMRWQSGSRSEVFKVVKR